MKRKLILITAIFILGVCCLTACVEPEKKLRTGSYLGESSKYLGDENGFGAGYGVMELFIVDGEITKCFFTLCELDGTQKGDQYIYRYTGSYREKAIRSLEIARIYNENFKAHSGFSGWDPEKDDTFVYKLFKEAAEEALKKASA